MEVKVPVVIPDEDLIEAAKAVIQERGLSQLVEETGWINQTNARKYLGVSKATFYYWEKAGKIPFSMIDGIKRYSKKDLDAMMRKHRV